MKNTILKTTVTFLLLLVMGSCAKWTDIKPKGYNMLQTVSEIDLLFNSTYSANVNMSWKSSMFMNNFYSLNFTSLSMYTFITEPLQQPLMTACVAWDESIDRASATETDNVYTTYYGMIGKICNPTILSADMAVGERAVANRLKAEAYVLRAWFHYNLVNYYAKAYNPVTAKEDGGIPYSMETDLLSVPNQKYSVQQVYDFMVADLDAAISSNSLAPPSQNRMRVNSAFAYAVKAKVLMSMRDYEGAYQAAAASLAIENTIDDYNDALDIGASSLRLTRLRLTSREDLFYMDANDFRLAGMTPELAAIVERGHIFFRHLNNYTSPISYFGIVCDLYGSTSIFLNPCGLSTVDMYLIQAECLIRKGDATSINSGVDLLNFIRRHRVAVKEIYEPKTEGYDLTVKIDPEDYYAPWTASNIAQGIAMIKQMERTENFHGPKYFFSMKRWNTEEAWKETLTKHMDCVISDASGIITLVGSYDFTLPPDSPLWIYPFPWRAIIYNKNLTQNY